MRSAEKSRTSTCSFADIVARKSINEFHKRSPAEVSYRQTVLATILLMKKVPETVLNCEQNDEWLTVIALGVGTKVLSMSLVESDASERKRVRDCHAEVLARRGLRCFLLRQLAEAQAAKSSSTSNSSIFEWNPSSNRFRLKEQFSFHFFSSSQPCGNASIKRWAKSAREEFRVLPTWQYPEELSVHPRYFATARQSGEVSFLMKRNTDVASDLEGTAGLADEVRNESADEAPTKKVSRSSSDFIFCPPGTVTAASGQGSVLTCSDKLALWNRLGLQGSLLSNHVEPVYLSTITIGRKFSRKHAERAMCCRTSNFALPADVEDLTGSLFAVNHPAILCSSVKFDESAIVTCNDGTTAVDGSCEQQQLRVGACFDEWRCLCWWAGMTTAGDTDNKAVVVNGRTGFSVIEDSTESELISPISSRVFAFEYLKLIGETCDSEEEFRQLKLRDPGSRLYQRTKFILKKEFGN